MTYDVTAWSNPLLMNLEGGWSGADVYAVVRGRLADGRAGVAAPRQPFPRSACSRTTAAPGASRPPARRATCSREVWHLPHTDLTYDDIGADPTVLEDFDVLVMPDGYAEYALQDLGAKGKKALREWVNDGRPHRRLAGRRRGGGRRSGHHHREVRHIPHEHARSTRPRRARPRLATSEGIGDRNWVMYQDDRTMQPGLGAAVATFPPAGDPAYATSGLTIGVGSTRRVLRPSSTRQWVSAVALVSFSVDPNFRAWTQGTQRMLGASSRSRSTELQGLDVRARSDFCGTPSSGRVRRRRGCRAAGSQVRLAAEKAAQDAAEGSPTSGRPSGSGSPATDAAAAAKILNRHGAEVTRIDLGADTLFLVANRQDLSYDEHPFFGLVVRDLERAGIGIGAASLP